jgi:ABC-type transport system involved in multi-copper enzyme maturation permease subunit
MVRDTFRQSLHTKLFWVMLAITCVSTLFAFSVDVSGDMKPVTSGEIPAYITPAEAEKVGLEKVKDDGIRVSSGEVSVGFGMMKIPLARSRDDAVKFLQTWLAAALADTLGVLLALLWTAGFLPTFLEPQSATVLFAKPAPRWAILLGKYIGVVLFVTLHAALFVLGTWTALGLKTGVWNGAYWMAVPLLAFNFAVFFAWSTFIAVCTRSTVATAFGTLLFWILCWAMNYTHHLAAAGGIPGMTDLSRFLIDAGYWLLPKPLDFAGIFYDAVGAQGMSVKVPELGAAQEAGAVRPELSVLSSTAFAAGTLALAAYELEQTDY